MLLILSLLLLGATTQAAPQVITSLPGGNLMSPEFSHCPLLYRRTLSVTPPLFQGQSDCAYVDEDVCSTVEQEVCEDGLEW